MCSNLYILNLVLKFAHKMHSEMKYVLEGDSRMCYIVVRLCAPKICFIK
jgi:hypothetical protein